MSKYYVKDNSESTLTTYYKKILYNSRFDYTPANVVDFAYGEKRLYGRINQSQKSIILKDQSELRVIDSATTYRALGFVQSAFKDMSAFFEKQKMQFLINPNQNYLSTLRVFKGWENPEQLYEEHLTAFTNVIVNKFTDRHVTALDFNIFLQEFENIIFTRESVTIVPFTKAAYMKSRYCPISTTGLAIEIADLKYSNDDDKIRHFINNPNWDFLVSATNKYGFMIDRDAPWRLVADVKSRYMQQKMREVHGGGSGATESFTRKFYKSTPAPSFRSFYKILLRIYNSVRMKIPYSITRVSDKNGSMRMVREKTPTYTTDDLLNLYPLETFFALFLKIRLKEEETVMSEDQENILYQDTMKLFYARGPIYALSSFETILNKTFDYVGSLHYNINIRNRMMAEQEEERLSVPTTPADLGGTGGGY